MMLDHAAIPYGVTSLSPTNPSMRFGQGADNPPSVVDQAEEVIRPLVDCYERLGEESGKCSTWVSEADKSFFTNLREAASEILTTGRPCDQTQQLPFLFNEGIHRFLDNTPDLFWGVVAGGVGLTVATAVAAITHLVTRPLSTGFGAAGEV